MVLVVHAIVATLKFFYFAHQKMSNDVDVQMDQLDLPTVIAGLVKFKKEQFVSQSLVVFDVAGLYGDSKTTASNVGSCT